MVFPTGWNSARACGRLSCAVRVRDRRGPAAVGIRVTKVTNMFIQDRICAAIGAVTADEFQRRLLVAVNPPNRARAVELRLDSLRNMAERKAFLRWLSEQRRLPTMIATCRAHSDNGQFAGSLESQLAVLTEAVRSGCGWCDVGVETASRMDPGELRQLLAPAKIIISLHHFHGVPANLRRLLKDLERHDGDAMKIAVRCQNLADARRLLELSRGRKDLVVIPMGWATFSARILALREGSALAFASVEEATAPGQLSIEELRKVYRLGAGERRPPLNLTHRSKVYGVIGDPIGHSLSPLLQNTAFASRGLDAIYVPFLVRDLRDYLKAIEPFGIAGFSVTLPHKEKILRHLDACDPLAAEIGAVNTVAVRSGRLYGYNTDYAGVLRAIGKRVSLPSSRVLLFGTGGSARAAAFALKRAGANVFICGRRWDRAKALAHDVGGEIVDRRLLKRESFEMIVNCTPVGMYPKGGCPFKANELNCRVVMDLVYRPRQTELLRLAEKLGKVTISGVEMFLEQGYEQFKIWTGRPAPEAAMRRALTSALDAEEGPTRARGRAARVKK
jgi:3-dehydroquinate dehydratase/shikimate dehydrogenase